MHHVTPQVFVVAKTALDTAGIDAYLTHIGAPRWTTKAHSDAEYLVEFMGRLCYRSWEPGMNANVTRVRQGNASYLKNIIQSRHGSVTEHASVSFVFADVSRVFTHELVRHRAGTAISQESLRFVRLTDLGQWLPTCITESPSAMDEFCHQERAHLSHASSGPARRGDDDWLDGQYPHHSSGAGAAHPSQR